MWLSAMSVLVRFAGGKPHNCSTKKPPVWSTVSLLGHWVIFNDKWGIVPGFLAAGISRRLEVHDPSGVVSLQRAGKYQRPAWRPSLGQKGTASEPSWRHSGP